MSTSDDVDYLRELAETILSNANEVSSYSAALCGDERRADRIAQDIDDLGCLLVALCDDFDERFSAGEEDLK